VRDVAAVVNDYVQHREGRRQFDHAVAFRGVAADGLDAAILKQLRLLFFQSDYFCIREIILPRPERATVLNSDFQNGGCGILEWRQQPVVRLGIVVVSYLVGIVLAEELGGVHT